MVYRAPGEPNGYFRTAIGKSVIQKGEIQVWRFQALSKQAKLIIGIIDTDNVTKRDVVGLFFDDKLHGYGISTYLGCKYHSWSLHGITNNNDGWYQYDWADQFKIRKNEV